MIETYQTPEGVYVSHRNEGERVPSGWSLRGRKTPLFDRGELEKRLGRHKYDYFSQVMLIESLRQLSTERRKDFASLSDQQKAELKTIERVLEKGGSFDDFIEEKNYTSSNSLQGGSFHQLDLKINDLNSKVFIKLLPDKKTYKASLAVQSRAAKISRHVMAPTYSDDRLKLIAFPFIEGETLDEKIAGLKGNPAGRKKVFERAIDVLADIYVKGTKEQFSDISLLELNDASNSFLTKLLFATNPRLKKANTTLFGRKRIKDAKLEELLKDYRAGVGAVLDDSRFNRLMHGDPHLRNFIDSNNELYLIDFDLARFGKIQLDLFKLFERSGVLSEPALKAHLLNYAFDRVRGDVRISRNEFMRLYDFTEVHEHFMSAGRYLSFSQDNNVSGEFGKKENLRELACLDYTRALNGLKRLHLEALASKIEGFIAANYRGDLHRLSERDIAGIRHLPDDCMLSTILSKGSLNEVALYNQAKKRVKVQSNLRKAKFALKWGTAIAAIGLAAYVGVTSGNSSNRIAGSKSLSTMQTIDQFMNIKGNEIYGTTLYNGELKEIVLAKNSEELFKVIGGKNSTILSDKDFVNYVMMKEDSRSPYANLIAAAASLARGEPTDKEVVASLMYATLLNSPERKALEQKGRFGMGLLSKDLLSYLLDMRRDGAGELGRFANDISNMNFAARSLGYFLLQNKGEVYTSLADYFIGKDIVDRARASVDKKEISNDINQYWEYLPDGPEKTLLSKAMSFYRAVQHDKHNKLIQSPEWEQIKRQAIQSDLLLWEYDHKDVLPSLKGSEVIKTPKFKTFVDKYHDKMMAFIACYDESMLKQAIEAASKTGIDSVWEFTPVSIRNAIPMGVIESEDPSMSDRYIHN